MKLNPLVSICVPTHNQNPVFLKKCIESAIQQTYKNIEIVINNNNTTNESLSYLKHLSEEAGEIIKISTNEHTLPLLESFIQALDNATGEYLFILPSDDFIEKNAIEVLVNTLHQHPDADCISGQWHFVDKEFSEVGNHINQLCYKDKILQVYDSLGTRNNYFLFSLIRAEFIKSMDISMNKKIKYAFDFYFTNEVTRRGKVVVIDNKLGNVQLHNLSRDQRTVDGLIDLSEIFFHTMCDIFEDKNLKNKISKKIIARFYLVHIKNLVMILTKASLKLRITAAQLINIFIYTVKMSLSTIILLIKL